MNSDYQAIYAQQCKLVDKWDHTGLLAHLSAAARVKMAVALENTRDALIGLNSAHSYGSNLERYVRIMLPLVRCTFGPLFERDRYRVMQLPTTLHFETPDSEDSIPILAQTLKLKVSLPEFRDTSGGAYWSDIREESEMIFKLSEDIRNEIVSFDDNWPDTSFYYFYVPLILMKYPPQSEFRSGYMIRFAKVP